jgi:cation-transporting ATPase E
MWVLLLIAHPYNLWRIGLVAAMGGIFVIVLAVPGPRNFFALLPGDLYDDAVALGIAGAAAVLLTVALTYDKWLSAVREVFHRPAA